MTFFFGIVANALEFRRQGTAHSDCRLDETTKDIGKIVSRNFTNSISIGKDEFLDTIIMSPHR